MAVVGLGGAPLKPGLEILLPALRRKDYLRTQESLVRFHAVVGGRPACPVGHFPQNLTQSPENCPFSCISTWPRAWEDIGV